VAPSSIALGETATAEAVLVTSTGVAPDSCSLGVPLSIEAWPHGIVAVTQSTTLPDHAGVARASLSGIGVGQAWLYARHGDVLYSQPVLVSVVPSDATELGTACRTIGPPRR